MPRRPRLSVPGYPLHIIQRGNNRQTCFGSDRDIAAYINWLTEGADKYAVDVHCWVFMTNHVHLLLTPSTADGASRLMQYIGRLYVRSFNERYARSGTLFEGRFRSSMVQSERYLLACLRYIELNPVRAGMVIDPADYKWSSYYAHAFGRQMRLWTPHPLYLALAEDSDERCRIYRELVRNPLSPRTLFNIRHCSIKGLILGSQTFREKFESLRRDPI